MNARSKILRLEDGFFKRARGFPFVAALAALFATVPASLRAQEPIEVTSPGGIVTVTFEMIDGAPTYHLLPDLEPQRAEPARGCLLD